MTTEPNPCAQGEDPQAEAIPEVRDLFARFGVPTGESTPSRWAAFTDDELAELLYVHEFSASEGRIACGEYGEVMGVGAEIKAEIERRKGEA